MENILVRCIENVASPKIRQRKIVFVEWLYPCIEMKGQCCCQDVIAVLQFTSENLDPSINLMFVFI